MPKCDRVFTLCAFLVMLLRPSYGQNWCQNATFHTWLQQQVPHTQHSMSAWCDVFAKQSCNPHILALINHPYEHRAWPTYQKHFITPKRLSAGRQYLKKHRLAFAKAESTYHVPAGIIAAILGVETNYGHNMGTFSAADALLTLGFCQPKRTPFFRHELRALMQLAEHDHLALRHIHSSYAGALGIPQFMPSNYHTLGVQASQEHPLDLFHHHDDAIMSIAHFLMMKGWHGHQPIVRKRPSTHGLNTAAQRHPQAMAQLSKVQRRGLSPHAVGLYQPSQSAQYEIYHNFNVLLRYNRSPQYALAVTLLAQHMQPDMATR